MMNCEASEPSSEQTWASLTRPLIELVCRQLSEFDLIDVSLVCRPWSAVAKSCISRVYPHGPCPDVRNVCSMFPNVSRINLQHCRNYLTGQHLEEMVSLCRGPPCLSVQTLELVGCEYLVSEDLDLRYAVAHSHGPALDSARRLSMSLSLLIAPIATVCRVPCAIIVTVYRVPCAPIATVCRVPCAIIVTVYCVPCAPIATVCSVPCAPIATVCRVPCAIIVTVYRVPCAPIATVCRVPCALCPYCHCVLSALIALMLLIATVLVALIATVYRVPCAIIVTVYRVPCAPIATVSRMLLLTATAPNLTQLDVSACPSLSDAALTHIRCLTNLSSLALSGCLGLSTTSLRSLSTLTALQSLDLSGLGDAHNKDLDLQLLAGNLTHLDISHSAIMDLQSMLALSSLTNLRSLLLDGCPNVTSSVLKAMSTVTSLETLSVRGCKLTFTLGLPILSTFSKLTTLYLTIDCWATASFANVAHLVLVQHPNLRELHMHLSASLSPEGIPGNMHMSASLSPETFVPSWKAWTCHRPACRIQGCQQFCPFVGSLVFSY
eukprot:gene23309-30549_t